MMKDIVYDIETFRNVFTCVLYHPPSGHRWIYEVSDRVDQSAAFVDLIYSLRAGGYRMVGFNNLGFDYPVIHHLCKLGNFKAVDAYNKAQQIIESQGGFEHMIWESDRLVPQLDLYKIHHFDNRARSTSLKALEFAMRSKFVQELPFSPHEPLAPDQIPLLIEYNAHDVAETAKFYELSHEMIEFRTQLTEQYGKDFTNHNDTKIGKDYFIMELERAAPGICYQNRQPRQTHRASIPLGDVIFQYVTFGNPEFARVLDYLKQTRITDTKSAPEMKDLHAEVGGLTFHFGTGGIHASMSDATIRETETHEIIDVDVTSYYPSLAIKNRVFPQHLSELFCEIYSDLFERRKQHAKGSAVNAMLKLALNGVYGDSNNIYSPFYDPQYTMTITINGQLLLCMLAEWLMTVYGLSIIQCNTDGVTVLSPRARRTEVEQVLRNWENLTRLTLESVNYRAMFIRDVNNYVAQSVDGKAKRKGAYEYKLAWHQDPSALIVPKAAEAVMLQGVNLREYIYAHADAFDFMMRGKAPRTSELMLTDGTKLPNIVRYCIAPDGPGLVKVMPELSTKPGSGPRRIGINVGHSVHIVNDIDDWDWSRLDREWYIREAEKLLRILR